MEAPEIHIANDFTKTLGARYKSEGKFSGEAFLEEHLLSKFLIAKENNTILTIYLDGVFGYPSSFISGSFGKLSVDYGADIVLKHINLVSENSMRIQKIKAEITQPKRK